MKGMVVVSFFFRRSNWKIAQGNFLSPCKFRKENRGVAGSVGGGFGTVSAGSCTPTQNLKGMVCNETPQFQV